MEGSPGPESAMASKTLDRGLRVLEAVASESANGGIGVAELAARLGLHRAQVYRLVGTLSEHRMIRRVDGARYVLGTAVVEMSGRVSGTLQSTALPYLHALAEDLEATAFLAIADGGEAIAIAVVEPRTTAMHVAYRIGFRHPLNRGAPGIAILAGRPPSPRDSADVSAARERGYASTSGQLQQGARGVAAPIRGVANLEASVGIVTLEGTLDENQAGRRVVKAASAICEALGHD